MPELVWKIVEEDERVVKGMTEAGEEWNLGLGGLERVEEGQHNCKLAS